MNIIGNKIRELRKARGLSIPALAKELGVGENSISNWELGRFEPSLFAVIRLADYFDITIDELVGRNK